MTHGVRELLGSSVAVLGPDEIFRDLNYWCKSPNFDLTAGELIEELENAPSGRFILYVKEIPKAYEDGDVGDIYRLVFVLRREDAGKIACFVRKDLMDTVESLFIPTDLIGPIPY